MTDVLVGRLVKPFGIKGELKLNPAADFWVDVLRSKRLILRRETAGGIDERSIVFERFRPHGNCYVVRVDGIDDRSAAEGLIGGELFVDADDIDVELPERTLPFQVIGSTVKSEDGMELGEVTSVVFSSAHDVYEIGGSKGTFLVPAIDEFIVSIDQENREITIRLIPGLIDE